jgi:amino acid transporter
MTRAGGGFLSTFFAAAFVAGSFGSALTSQASVSRILYCMGRDGVLPTRIFGRINSRFGTPDLVILLVSVISLLALWVSLGLLTSMICFGALVAFSVVNVAVMKHHLVDRGLHSASEIFRYGVVPVIGCALTAWLWTSLSKQSLVVGIGWLACGAVYLALLTRGFTRKPPALDLAD